MEGDDSSRRDPQAAQPTLDQIAGVKPALGLDMVEQVLHGGGAADVGGEKRSQGRVELVASEQRGGVEAWLVRFNRR